MIRYANESDWEVLMNYDKHICPNELKNSIHAKRVLVVIENDIVIGWLRYNLFWDQKDMENNSFNFGKRK